MDILVVEDDADISNLICEMLMHEGHKPRPAYSGTEAIMCLSEKKWQLVLLDLMLPGLTGEQVLREMRRDKQMPVIVLSAKTDKKSKLDALLIGADDYVTKPFDIDELSARIHAQLRRLTEFSASTQKDNVLCFHDLILDSETREVSVGDKLCTLTAREFDILYLLMKYPKKVFTRANIFESIWQDEFLGDENTVNVHISNLRSKLCIGALRNDYIKTVWGIGFKISD
jgi:DNA-binding response OmpR family regulator